MAGFAGVHEAPPLFFMLFLTMYLFTLVENLAIILVVASDHRLRRPMYFFLTHLSCLEIWYTSVTVPKMLAGFIGISGGKNISYAGCLSQLFIFTFLGATECFLLAAMAYDRYVAICHPLRYPVLMNQKLCLHMTMGSWLLGGVDGLMQAATTLSFPYCHSREINHFFCEAPTLVRLACADTTFFEFFMYVCCILMLLIPLSLILASYILILAAVLSMRSTAARKKAFGTCSSHLAVVGLFYGTLIFTYMRPKSSRSVAHDKVVSAFYTIFTPVLNPLIYSVRNKEVKGALRKWLEKHFLGHR